MLFVKSSNSVRVWEIVKTADGDLRSGLVEADAMMSIIAPDDSASLSLEMSESSQIPGVYYYDVPASFFTQHGVGFYVVICAIDTTVVGGSGTPTVIDAIAEILHVSQNDFDTLWNPVYIGQIVDATLDEVLTGHFGADTVGEALSLIRGLVQNNYVLDQTVFNANGFMTSGRMRLFPSAAAVAASTDGGTGEGETATFIVEATTETGEPTKLKMYKVRRA